MSVVGGEAGTHGRHRGNDAIDPIRPLGPASKIAYAHVENIGDGIGNEAARIHRTDQLVGGMASRGTGTAAADAGVAQLK